MKFKKAVETFQVFSELHHSQGTQKFYRRKEKELLPFFGNMECEDITRTVIDKFLLKEKKRNPHLSAATLNKFVGAIKFIVKNETENIITYRKIPEIQKITPIIPDNIISLIFAYYRSENTKNSDKRNSIMFRMLLDTGLRINELVNLRIQDIDFDTSTIHVKITKTKLERYIFFTGNTHIALVKYIKETKVRDYIFIDFKTDNKLTVDNVETICYRLKNKLDVKMSISPHKWRHTFATKFQKKNKDLPVLQELLGHRDINQTERYLHFDREYLHEVYFKEN